MSSSFILPVAKGVAFFRRFGCRQINGHAAVGVFGVMLFAVVHKRNLIHLRCVGVKSTQLWVVVFWFVHQILAPGFAEQIRDFTGVELVGGFGDSSCVIFCGVADTENCWVVLLVIAVCNAGADVIPHNAAGISAIADAAVL